MWRDELSTSLDGSTRFTLHQRYTCANYLHSEALGLAGNTA